MRRVLIGLVVLAVLALAWSRWVRLGPTSLAPAAVVPDSVSAGLKSARLYFASPGADSLVSEARDLVETGTLHERVAALVAELDRGPRATSVAALPAGTSVLHVYLDERGLMTLDLSRAFVQGFHGGSSAEYLAVASLVRTLGANLPEVKQVLVVCGGASLGTLGGHLPLDRPIDVSDWP